MIGISTHIISALAIISICVIGMVAPTTIENHSGALVVRFVDEPMFQLNGLIFGKYHEHEYGHFLQQKDIGDLAYYTTVAIPSALTNIGMAVAAIINPYVFLDSDEYYALPWEADANIRAMECNR
jgi:hypothetical protein